MRSLSTRLGVRNGSRRSERRRRNAGKKGHETRKRRNTGGKAAVADKH
jgi:hypothetical protein